jgi:hypothetical protein
MTTPGEVFGRGLATQCMADVIKLNGYSDDVSVAVDKAIKPTILAKDDSMAPSSHSLFLNHPLIEIVL